MATMTMSATITTTMIFDKYVRALTLMKDSFEYVQSKQIMAVNLPLLTWTLQRLKTSAASDDLNITAPMDMSHDSFYHSERVVNRNYKAAGHTRVHSWIYMLTKTGTKTRDDGRANAF